MLVDNGPILEEDRRCYEELRRSMEALERRLETFDLEDVPAFDRWVGLHFGPKLNALRDLELKIHEKEVFLSRCRLVQRERGLSPTAAYAWVTAEAEAGVTPGDPEPSRSAGNGGFDGRDPDGAGTDSEDDFFDFLGSLGIVGVEGASRVETDGREQRVKKLYREIALRLHPDRSIELRGQRRDLWEKAREAYVDQDEFQLEIVLSRIEAMDGSVPSRNGLAWYGEMIEGCRFRLGVLADAISVVSEHPAWRFTRRKPASLKRLARRIGRELDEEERDFRGRLDRLEWRLEDLERRLRKSEARKVKPRPRPTAVPDPRQAAFSFSAV
jgi:hypothetical protein